MLTKHVNKVSEKRARIVVDTFQSLSGKSIKGEAPGPGNSITPVERWQGLANHAAASDIKHAGTNLYTDELPVPCIPGSVPSV